MIGGRLVAFSLHAAFLCHTVVCLSSASEYASYALQSVCATMAQTLVIRTTCICLPRCGLAKCWQRRLLGAVMRTIPPPLLAAATSLYTLSRRIGGNLGYAFVAGQIVYLVALGLTSRESLLYAESSVIMLLAQGVETTTRCGSVCDSTTQKE